MVKKEISEKNYNYCKRTIELKDTLEAGFLSLAERLAKISQEELYLPSWETFGDFCEEMSMSPTTASKLVNIHMKLVTEMNIPKETLLSLGGYSDLSEILTLATTKKATVALIEELAPLTRVDRRKFLTERKTGIEMGDCGHEETYTIRICKKCGFREKIYENT